MFDIFIHLDTIPACNIIPSIQPSFDSKQYIFQDFFGVS